MIKTHMENPPCVSINYFCLKLIFICILMIQIFWKIGLYFYAEPW